MRGKDRRGGLPGAGPIAVAVSVGSAARQFKAANTQGGEWGRRLCNQATTTAAPSPYPVPANSGSGRRVVYSKSRMRVWIVEADGTAVRTYLVSGRYNQPTQGTYSVFSRSSFTCHLGNSHVCMRWMVRFAHGPTGDNIGFHEIPRRDGVPMQKDSQLGQALSSGCVRQSTADAQYMWAWAGLGTKVVVIW